MASNGPPQTAARFLFVRPLCMYLIPWLTLGCSPRNPSFRWMVSPREETEFLKFCPRGNIRFVIMFVCLLDWSYCKLSCTVCCRLAICWFFCFYIRFTLDLLLIVYYCNYCKTAVYLNWNVIAVVCFWLLVLRGSSSVWFGSMFALLIISFCCCCVCICVCVCVFA